MILQRWEPVIADDFPSSISFWVRIHGIPLHYWTEEALHAIGSELGTVETKDVKQGRIRVQINGLKPLVVSMDITLKGGQKQIEVEYEKIEKHCFLCRSLSHEKESCPQKRNFEAPSSDTRGINETRTLESLDAYKKAKDERKLEKGRQVDNHRRGYEDNQPHYHLQDTDHRSYRGDRRRSPPRSYNSYNSRPLYISETRDRGLPQTREANRLSGRSRSFVVPLERTPHRLPATQRISHEHGSAHSRLGERVWVEKGSQSQVSHTPPPRPQREAMGISQEVNSSHDRRSALDRLALPTIHPSASKPQETPTMIEPSSAPRLPALQRIEPPMPAERTPLLLNGVANSESGRLQEVEIQYMEDTFPVHILNSAGVPSSSRVPARERLSLPQESPIRSLSEDRRYVAVNCATLPPLVINEPLSQVMLPPPDSQAKGKRKGGVTKATGKRKAQEQPTTRKKVVRSPLHGVSLKKRRISKVQNSPRQSPRRKLYDESTASEDLPVGSKKNPKAKERANPPINLIPAMTRQGTNFRSARSTLP